MALADSRQHQQFPLLWSRIVSNGVIVVDVDPESEFLWPEFLWSVHQSDYRLGEAVRLGFAMVSLEWSLSCFTCACTWKENCVSTACRRHQTGVLWSVC